MILQAGGSGGTDGVAGADSANYIDSNKNGVKDPGEVFDANHNEIDDATEGLAGVTVSWLNQDARHTL